jgi:hypothetical protein
VGTFSWEQDFVWTIHRCKCEFIIVNVSTTFRLIASFYLWTVSYMNIWQRTVYLSNTFLLWLSTSLVELTQIYLNKVPNYWNKLFIFIDYLSVNARMWSNTLPVWYSLDINIKHRAVHSYVSFNFHDGHFRESRISFEQSTVD